MQGEQGIADRQASSRATVSVRVAIGEDGDAFICRRVMLRLAISKGPSMKRSIVFLSSALFAAVTSMASAQSASTDAPTQTQKSGDAKAKKAEDFAAKHKAMQDASKSSASSTGTPPPSQSKKSNLSGKDSADMAMDVLQFKGSKPVDKNAKAQAPAKNIKEMTPEERAKRREEIVKESKP
jgi:hypothetical protein